MLVKNHIFVLCVCVCFDFYFCIDDEPVTGSWLNESMTRCIARERWTDVPRVAVKSFLMREKDKVDKIEFM